MIDITAALSNPNKAFSFSLKKSLDENLLRYPNSKFCGDAEINGDYFSLDNDIYLNCQILFSIDCFCDLCGAPMKKDFKIPLDAVFFKTPPDKDAYAYSQNKIDVDMAINDEIVLTMPNQILHKPDCKGLCPVCFCDKNEHTCNCEDSGVIDKENPFQSLKNLKY